MLASFIANILLRNPWSLKQIESDTIMEDLKGNEEIEAIGQILQLMEFGGMESLVKAANKKVWLTGEFGACVSITVKTKSTAVHNAHRPGV